MLLFALTHVATAASQEYKSLLGSNGKLTNRAVAISLVALAVVFEGKCHVEGWTTATIRKLDGMGMHIDLNEKQDYSDAAFFGTDIVKKANKVGLKKWCKEVAAGLAETVGMPSNEPGGMPGNGSGLTGADVAALCNEQRDKASYLILGISKGILAVQVIDAARSPLPHGPASNLLRANSYRSDGHRHGLQLCGLSCGIRDSGHWLDRFDCASGSVSLSIGQG